MVDRLHLPDRAHTLCGFFSDIAFSDENPADGLLELAVALRFEVSQEAAHLWIRRSPFGQTSGWGLRPSIVELPDVGRGLRLGVIADPSRHGAVSALLSSERRDIGELFSTLLALPVVIADETERDSRN
jgi:hypothetical protein